MILLILSCSNFCQAQKFKEWFRQKKTQKAYLIEQIAFLNLYLKLAEKGYDIAKDGLTTIGDIKRGEFKLHKNHFDSLLVVKKVVKDFGGVGYIHYFRAEVERSCKQGVKLTIESQAFDPKQQEYLTKVFEKVVKDCAKIVDFSDELLKDNNLAMTDDQRLTRLTQLREQMLVNYKFARAFRNEIAVLIAGKAKEQSDVSAVRALHGLN